MKIVHSAPSPGPDFDVVIAGAGLGGLSVAAALAVPDGPRVLVVDPRNAWGNDRTWCFWATDGDPLLEDASHRWRRWRVSVGERSVVRSAPGEVYAHVPAERVYARALEAIAAHPRVTRLQGRVGAVREFDGCSSVEVGDVIVTAAAFVDARPPSHAAGAPAGERRILQHFLGWHVRADRPCFDPEVVTLMDFETPGSSGVHFRYILPYSATEALVEDTWFGDAPHAHESYRTALTVWLDSRAQRWEVLREEVGVLPMTTERFDQHPTPGCWRVGLAGGAARPATGYAYLATRKMAEDIAQRLLGRSIDPLPPVRSARIEAIDGVFLEWMHGSPERAPAAFLRLFDRVDPGALVRFLSNRSSVTDDLRVMAALAPVAGPTMIGAVRARM